MTRFCTSELKIKPIESFMRSMGHRQWDNITGIRADEPKRLSRRRAKPISRHSEDVFPLADAGIGKPEVFAFWRNQPFDLRLDPHESNCTLCFMKGAKIRAAILQQRPEVADWWALAEEFIGARFRNEHTVMQLKQYALDRLKAGRRITAIDPDATQVSCFCGID